MVKITIGSVPASDRTGAQFWPGMPSMMQKRPPKDPRASNNWAESSETVRATELSRAGMFAERIWGKMG